MYAIVARNIITGKLCSAPGFYFSRDTADSDVVKMECSGLLSLETLMVVDVSSETYEEASRNPDARMAQRVAEVFNKVILKGR